jgi:RNA polymerase sigma-70 factor (ECF subfamily)
VFRIAANLATDYTRHQHVRGRFDGDDSRLLSVASSAPQPDAEMMAQQEHALLKQAIAGLPEKRRTVFLLRTAQELPYGEIAARLGISVSAVEKHMNKAILHCRAHVDKARETIQE